MHARIDQLHGWANPYFINNAVADWVANIDQRARTASARGRPTLALCVSVAVHLHRPFRSVPCARERGSEKCGGKSLAQVYGG